MVYGMVLYGMIWCMVWKAWHGVWYGIIRYDMVYGMEGMV